MQVHLLCSGGMDSTTLAFHYRSLSHQVSLHWLDYGQASRDMEWLAAKWVAGTTGAPLHAHQIQGLQVGPGEIPGRNRALIEAIVPHVTGPALISLGIHAGCEYEDTTPAFQHEMQAVLDGIFGGVVRLDCPFIHLTKSDVAQAAEALGVPIEQTYSCDAGGPAPCGSCRSCKERGQALLDRGLPLLV